MVDTRDLDINPKNEVETKNPSERFLKNAPIKLFKSHPELVNHEAVYLENHLVIAVDMPGFSSVQKAYPELATKFFNDARVAVAGTLDPSILPLTNAGDEMLSTAAADETHILSIIAFSLDAQVSFMDTIQKPEYSQIREFLEAKKGVKPPYIHAGITRGNLTVQLLKLGENDNGEINRHDLLVMGKSLEVKDAAKERFTAIHGAAIDIPDVAITPNITLAPKVIRILENAGLVLENDDPQNPYYHIHLSEEESYQKAREILTRASESLKREAKIQTKETKPFRNGRDVDDEELINVAKGFTHHYNRGDSERTGPPHKDKEGGQSIGDCAFYDIAGLEDLRGGLTRANVDEKTSSLLVSLAANHIAQDVSNIICNDGGIDIEHTECDPRDTLKIIAHNNVFQENPIFSGDFSKNPEVLGSIVSSIRHVQSAEFHSRLAIRLKEFARANRLSISESTLQTIMEKVHYKIQVGLASCESDDLTSIVHEDTSNKIFAWGWPPEGSLTSAAARFCSLLAHERFSDRHTALTQKAGVSQLSVAENQELTSLESNLDLLWDLSQKDCLVMQSSIAQKLELAPTLNLEGLQLKGFPQMDLAIFDLTS